MKKIVIAFLVAGAIFFGYMSFIHYWYFNGEDWGSILRGSLIKSVQDILLTLKCGHCVSYVSIDDPQGLLPLGDCVTFFSCLYRPMLAFFYALQYHLFHTNALAYFSFIIALHAACAGILCYFLLCIVPPVLAVLTTFFFGFHPTLVGWLGKIDTGQHQINLFLFLLICVVGKKYLETDKKVFFISTNVLFMVALLTRETLIVVPAIVFMVIAFWGRQVSPDIFRKLIMLGCGFSLVALCYLLVRYLAYPISSQALFLVTQRNNSMISVMASVQWLQSTCRVVYDIFWLQWFPWTTYDVLCNNAGLLMLYRFSKVIIIAGLGYSFVMTAHKKKIIFLICAFLMLLWPQVLAPYAALRFYYEALPVVVVAIAMLLVGFFKVQHRYMQAGVCLGLAGLIIFNLSANIAAMKATRRVHENDALSLQFFKNEYASSLLQTPLLILNAPSPLSAIGITQAIQLLGISTASPLWHFDELHIHNPGEHVDNVQVSRKGNEFRLKSTNQDTWFSLVNSCYGKKDFLQAIVIHNQIDTKIYDFSFTLKEEVQGLRVVFWVPEQRVFVECSG